MRSVHILVINENKIPYLKPDEEPTSCKHTDEERALIGTVGCTPEINKALEYGYKILQIYEVHHFKHKSDRLFKDYMDTFIKMKYEASKPPKDIKRF